MLTCITARFLLAMSSGCRGLVVSSQIVKTKGRFEFSERRPLYREHLLLHGSHRLFLVTISDTGKIDWPSVTRQTLYFSYMAPVSVSSKLVVDNLLAVCAQVLRFIQVHLYTNTASLSQDTPYISGYKICYVLFIFIKFPLTSILCLSHGF